MVNVKTRAVKSTAVEPTPVAGVVKAMVGGFVVPVVCVSRALAASVKRQPDCTLVPRSGIVIFTLPPVGTRPAVLNETVATSAKPGVSVFVVRLSGCPAVFLVFLYQLKCSTPARRFQVH